VVRSCDCYSLPHGPDPEPSLPMTLWGLTSLFRLQRVTVAQLARSQDARSKLIWPAKEHILNAATSYR
jgi:hypothetical protein